MQGFWARNMWAVMEIFLRDILSVMKIAYLN